MATHERVETLIIGGGQAGLAVAYYLKSHERDFLILDAGELFRHPPIGRFRGC